VTGKQLLLSEQNLLDCGWYLNNKACFGGYQVRSLLLHHVCLLFWVSRRLPDLDCIGCIQLLASRTRPALAATKLASFHCLDRNASV